MDVELAEDAPQGWTVISVSGAIDVTSSHLLDGELHALTEVDTRRLIMDLDQVDFIDSTGLGLLEKIAQRLRAADGDLRLVCSNSRVLRLFAVAGLTDHVAIGDSTDEVASAPAPEQVDS